MDGYIKWYRKIIDNPVICKDSDHVAVWQHLLVMAQYRERQAVFKGETITLNPGQLITGRKAIAKKYKIDENKVQRILKLFENEQQIEQQTSNQNRLITIKNWNMYQQGGHPTEQRVNNKRTTTEQRVNNKRTTTEQRVNTYKNIKKYKNDKNEKKYIGAAPPDGAHLTEKQPDWMVAGFSSEAEHKKFLEEFRR